MSSTLLSFVARNSDTLAETYEQLFSVRIHQLLHRCSRNFYGLTPDNLDDPVFAMHRRLQPSQPLLLRASLTLDQKYEAMYELTELLPLIFYTDLLFVTLDQHILTDHVPPTIKLSVIEHLFQLNIPFSRIEVYDQLLQYFIMQPSIRAINTLMSLKETAPDNLFALDVCECAVAALMLEAHSALSYDDYDNIYTRASALLRVVLAHNYGLPLSYESECTTTTSSIATALATSFAHTRPKVRGHVRAHRTPTAHLLHRSALCHARPAHPDRPRPANHQALRHRTSLSTQHTVFAHRSLRSTATIFHHATVDTRHQYAHVAQRDRPG